MKSINPYNSEVLQEYEPYSNEKVNEILSKVDEAFQEWSQLSIQERSKFFDKLQIHLEENARHYGKIATLEMGKPLEQAISEVQKCAKLCGYYAENTEDFLKPKELESEYKQSTLHYQPLGTVLAVMPWNFPYWQVFRFLVPNLMAGNTGVLKHASNVSGCALAIEEMLEKSGFPKNVFRTLLISSSEVEDVIKNDYIKAVTLTGSEKAGGIVASQAGKEIKKTVLELGGSDCFIILNDADLDKTLDGAVFGRYQNNGQSCIASKRFLVQEGIYDEFMDRFKKRVSELNVGDPLLEDTFIGPLAKQDFVEQLEKQVNESLNKGAKLLVGGKPSGENNQFYLPTILTNVEPGMPAFDEELFGPVAACMKFSSIEDAIELANNSIYGLGGSVWTQDEKKGTEIALQIVTGTVAINDYIKSNQSIPFGGVKKSGYGSELAQEGQLEFLNHKVIHSNF